MTSLAARLLEALDQLDTDKAGAARTRAEVRGIVVAHLVDVEITTVVDAVKAPAAPAAPDTLANLVADVATSLEIIAENTKHAPVVITADQAHDAWDAVGMRMNTEKAIPFLERLGISVEP